AGSGFRKPPLVISEGRPPIAIVPGFASMAEFLRAPALTPAPVGRDVARRSQGGDFMRDDICIIAAAIMAFWAIGSAAIAQQGSSTQPAITADPASNPDQELGRRF